MAVFRYTASIRGREEHEESGTVVAKNQEEAKQKVKALDFTAVRVRPVKFFAGLILKWTADVR